MIRLVTTPLLAIGLLLTTLGCSKKEETVTPAVGTSSYKRNTVTVSGQARASVTTFTQTGQTTDVLQIALTDTPQLQSNTQSALVVFNKAAGQPTSAYRLAYINVSESQSGGTTTCPATSSTATLQEISPGVFSGTFSGSGSSAGGIQTTLTDGVFTDARL